MSDEDAPRRGPSIDDLLKAVIASDERGEKVDQDALVRENPQHAELLLGFFAGRDLMELSPSSKPTWFRRWLNGIQITFVPLCCFQLLKWIAELVYAREWDIQALNAAVGVLFMAIMFIGIPLVSYENAYHLLGRGKEKRRIEA